MGLRAPLSPRRAAAALIVVSVVVSLTISRAIAQASEQVAIIDAQAELDPFAATATGVATTSSAPTDARVLLLGDSVMDQQGSAAAFLLRQHGINARAIGLWGSGLLTADQYDYGKTNLSGMWFTRARAAIARVHPDLVGVYLNHNYWPPFPHDANGAEIADLWTDAGQAMIRQQARAFITLLRERGARVFFVAPIPTGPNAIWHGYAPVLREMHVPVAHTTSVVANADGSRTETKPSCNGTPERVRPEGDLHLTRFGAGRAGTALATYIAARLRVDLRGEGAPGERTVALVPRAGGDGYWLVGCDGSVFHFGDAPALGGAVAAVAGHGGVVAATPAPGDDGLWLVTADGTIASVGDAPSLTFTARPSAPVTGAAAVPGAVGLWAVTATGDVLRAGTAADFGHPSGAPGRFVGIASSPHGRGYLLATSSGEVNAFGDAKTRRSAPGARGTSIVGIAAAPAGRGYWLTAADGRVIATGSARFRGTGTWHRAAVPWAAVAPPPGPTVGIVARPGSNAGYWVFGATGRVVARGNAKRFGGDDNLAMFTQ